jgi:UrcA family protein
MKALALAAAAVVALTAAPAAASERVRLDDLRLDQESDVTRLDARIEDAARRLCASSANEAAARTCRRQAVSRAAHTRRDLVARAYHGRPVGVREIEIN